MQDDDWWLYALRYPIVMRANRLWSFGFGFGVLSTCINLALRFATMPIIGWQPSLLTAEIWLVLTFVGAAVGFSIMTYAALPENLSWNLLPWGAFLLRSGRILGLWLVAILFVGLTCWQSIALYELQARERAREVAEYPALTEEQQKKWATAFAPYSDKIGSIEIVVFDSRSELFVDSFRNALQTDNLYATVHQESIADGVGVTSDSAKLEATVTALFRGLGNRIRPAPPSVKTDPKMGLGDRYLLQIEIGRRMVQP